MDQLIFPRKITGSLIDRDHQPVRVPDVLLRTHLFARHKNDFFLQPFVTDSNRVATITKDELLAEVEAHYDSGAMDYHRVEECIPSVEISCLSVQEIRLANEDRSRVWKSLLKG